MRMTWRKQPHSSGLASIGEGPRGAILKVDGEDVGFVNALSRDIGLGLRWNGWYWYAVGDRIPLRNSSAGGLFYNELDKAKKACKEYVSACLREAT